MADNKRDTRVSAMPQSIQMDFRSPKTLDQHGISLNLPASSGITLIRV